MTYTVKFRGDITRPILAAYTCPVHGEFDAEVARDESGGAPEVIECTVGDPFDDCIGCGGQPSAPGAPDCKRCNGTARSPCGRDAVWTPTPVGCSVRRVEVVRGKWEKPERPTYLDTRKLGEGQDIDDFREERRKIWDEKRKAEVMKMVRE